MRMEKRANVARKIADLSLREERGKEPPVEEEVSEEVKKVVRETIDDGFEGMEAVYDVSTKGRSVGERDGVPWTDREDDLLIKKFYTMIEALALVHQRNPGIVRGRLHKLLRDEYEIWKER